MKNIYKEITEQIVQALEDGVRPWHQPWNTAHMEGRIAIPLRQNGVAYRGVNVLALWMQAMAKGYASPIWMTYRQAQALGANVRKGEKGSLVVYADKITRTETNAATGEESERAIPFMKGYTVFNAEQIEGLSDLYYVKPAPLTPTIQRIARVEAFFAATGVTVRHGGNRAYYSASTDHVQMPPLESFHDAGAYYATLGHETTHWTKHPTRLEREFGRKRWGDEGYAMEELVAELGAAFLCADLELTPEPRDEHASYIEHWLKVLKSDNRAIFAAASHAQRAADFLHGLQADAKAEAAA
jgi:antirestriction protein ArdC